MSKGQHGNREAKKPKKAPVAPKPAAPLSGAPAEPTPQQRQKK